MLEGMGLLVLLGLLEVQALEGWYWTGPISDPALVLLGLLGMRLCGPADTLEGED